MYHSVGTGMGNRQDTRNKTVGTWGRSQSFAVMCYFPSLSDNILYSYGNLTIHYLQNRTTAISQYFRFHAGSLSSVLPRPSQRNSPHKSHRLTSPMEEFDTYIIYTYIHMCTRAYRLINLRGRRHLFKTSLAVRANSPGLTLTFPAKPSRLHRTPCGRYRDSILYSQYDYIREYSPSQKIPPPPSYATHLSTVRPWHRMFCLLFKNPKPMTDRLFLRPSKSLSSESNAAFVIIMVR